MNFERKFNQVITLWRTTPDGYGGYTYSTPEVYNGRWEHRNEIFRDENGDEAVARVTVYLPVDFKENDYVALGDHHTEVTNPGNVGAEQVRFYYKIPDLRSAEYLKKGLM